MFSLEFDTDNAAFDGADAAPEIARILDQVKRRLSEFPEDEDFEDSFKVFDLNGNVIGDCCLILKRDRYITQI